MYILHRGLSKRGANLVIFGVLMLAIGGGALYVKSFLSSDTVIGPAPAAVVSHVYGKEKKTRHFDTAQFSFDAPKDWESFTPDGAYPGSLSWRNTANNKGVQVITLYMDTLPPNTAVNRAVGVSAVGPQITVNGDVSENCVNFTNQDATSKSTGKAAAKWQNVNFTCDTGNYLRNLVGTSTEGGAVALPLEGPTQGKHKVFFTYNDATVNPDFTIFTAMLQTFKLK